MVAGGGKASDATSNVRNKEAKSVLLHVRQKLDGTDTGAQLSVAGQVNHLIQVRTFAPNSRRNVLVALSDDQFGLPLQEAVNPDNLCRLFSGWQPWV